MLFASFDAELFGTDSPSCGHVVQDLLTGEYLLENLNNDLTLDQALDCQAELDIIAEIHLNDECPEL